MLLEKAVNVLPLGLLRRFRNTPKEILLSAIVILTFCAGCSSSETRPSAVILVTIDTLRADHLGCYGYPRNTSPFIDQLAASSILFENAYSSTSYTSPAHVSIFTSLHPTQHKILRNGQKNMDPHLLVLTEIFKSEGYDTAAACSVKFLIVLERGFDTFTIPDADRSCPANETIDRAIQWLSQKEPSDNFFLWVHLFDPHIPYTLRTERQEQIRFRSSDESERFMQHAAKIHGRFPTLEGERLENWIDMINAYDGEIAFVDSEIERLYRYMDRRGLNSNVLWVITSDHGEGLGDHNHHGHEKHIYNEQVHVPLLFHQTNGVYQNGRVNRIVRHVDILPTLAALLAYSLPEHSIPARLQGESFLPLLKNTTTELPRRYSFAERRPKDDNMRKDWEPGRIYSLQDLQYKYILHSEGIDEFYDLETDPLELVNLIDTPSEMKDHFRETLKARYIDLMLDAREVKSIPDIDEGFIEELKALGYM